MLILAKSFVQCMMLVKGVEIPLGVSTSSSPVHASPGFSFYEGVCLGFWVHSCSVHYCVDCPLPVRQPRALAVSPVKVKAFTLVASSPKFIPFVLICCRSPRIFEQSRDSYTVSASSCSLKKLYRDGAQAIYSIISKPGF